MKYLAPTIAALPNAADIQLRANRIARKAGYMRADIIMLEDMWDGDDYVADHIRYGYRKYTTGEYVPLAYRSKFGWKNTYYQPACTTVVLGIKNA